MDQPAAGAPLSPSSSLAAKWLQPQREDFGREHCERLRCYVDHDESVRWHGTYKVVAGMIQDVQDTLETLSGCRIVADCKVFGSRGYGLSEYQSDGDVVATVLWQDHHSYLGAPQELRLTFCMSLLMRCHREPGLQAARLKSDQKTLEVAFFPGPKNIQHVDIHVSEPCDKGACFWPLQQCAMVHKLMQRASPVSGIDRQSFVRMAIAYLKHHGVGFTPSSVRPYIKTLPLTFSLFAVLDDALLGIDMHGWRDLAVVLQFTLRAWAQKVMNWQQLNVETDQLRWTRRDGDSFPHDIVVVRDQCTNSPIFGMNMAYTLRKNQNEMLEHGIRRWSHHLQQIAEAAVEEHTWPPVKE